MSTNGTTARQPRFRRADAAIVSSQVEVSVVVPIKDEAESVPELARRVTAALAASAERFELILVDDGSADDSWTAACEAAAECMGVIALRHRRNFGKAAALATGLAFAGGRVVITMDGDLQDDPDEIPRFVAAIDGGRDVVSGWKRLRHDPLAKRLPSKLFNAVTRRLSGVELHDFNCGYKAYSADAARTLRPFLYGEMHRYLPVLLAARGYRVGELEVRHHARRFGRSKYGVGRMLAGACDLVTVLLLTRYRYRPLHAFGSLAGIVVAAAAVASIAAGLLGAGGEVSWWAAIAGLAAGGLLLVAGAVCELLVHAMGPPPATDQLVAAAAPAGLRDRVQETAGAVPLMVVLTDADAA